MILTIIRIVKGYVSVRVGIVEENDCKKQLSMLEARFKKGLKNVLINFSYIYIYFEG